MGTRFCWERNKLKKKKKNPSSLYRTKVYQGTPAGNKKILAVRKSNPSHFVFRADSWFSRLSYHGSCSSSSLCFFQERENRLVRLHRRRFFMVGFDPCATLSCLCALAQSPLHAWSFRCPSADRRPRLYPLCLHDHPTCFRR